MNLEDVPLSKHDKILSPTANAFIYSGAKFNRFNYHLYNPISESYDVKKTAQSAR